MKSSDSRGSRDEQSASLPGQAGAVERRLAPGQVAGTLGGEAGPGRLHRLLHDLAGLARVLLQPLGQLLVGRPLGQRADGRLPSLALVWPSNCGSRRRTEMMAVRPSRMSSPLRFSSFSFSRLRARA